MRRVLVLGDARHRGTVARAIESIGGWDVVDCDPALGDCVMYVRLEESRYDAFVFVGWYDPVTRGALAVAPGRSVVIPLFDDARELDAVHDGYLFRLPRAIGFRAEREQEALVRAVPQAAEVPSEIVGSLMTDQAAWRRLLDHLTQRGWQWQAFIADVERQVGDDRRVSINKKEE